MKYVTIMGHLYGFKNKDWKSFLKALACNVNLEDATEQYSVDLGDVWNATDWTAEYAHQLLGRPEICFTIFQGKQLARQPDGSVRETATGT
jgi:hypothetical protein